MLFAFSCSACESTDSALVRLSLYPRCIDGTAAAMRIVSRTPAVTAAVEVEKKSSFFEIRVANTNGRATMAGKR
jgi:hypothetical protein